MANVQQCKHCDREFSNSSLWREHYDWHTAVQHQLGRRSATRHLTEGSEPSLNAVDHITNPVTRMQLRSDDFTKELRLEPLWDEADDCNLIPTDAQMEQYLEKAIADFPPYEGGGIDNVTAEPTLKCPDCDFYFYTEVQRKEHCLSKYCKGNEITIYIMVVDSSKPGGYYVYRKNIAFESKTVLFRCIKCNDAFVTDDERKQHETDHQIDEVECLHCQKKFQSQYELEEHYNWHDDVHFRHHIDLSMESLKGVTGEAKDCKTTESHTGGPLAESPARVRNPWNMRDHYPRHDGDVVAISFYSKEDLEMRYASNGILKDLAENFAHSHSPSGMNRIAGIMEQKKGSFGTPFKDVLRKNEASRSLSSQPHSISSRNNSSEDPVRTAGDTDEYGHMELQLFYLHSRPGWVLANDKSQTVEFYAKRDQLTQEEVQHRVPTTDRIQGESKVEVDIEQLLSEIGDYAKTCYVEDFLGLSTLTENPDAGNHANEVYLESLRAWFDKEKQNAERSYKSEVLRGLPILGYGSHSRIHVRDGLGRPRSIAGNDLSNLIPIAIGPPCGTLDVVRRSLGARGERSLVRGDIEGAGQVYMEILQAITALYGDEQTKCLVLFHLAANVYANGGDVSKSAKMYMQGLQYCQKLYGLKSMNNFTMMTNLAIYYENIGRLEDAAALYRRAARGRINCGEQEDALMNIQELATVYRKMGRDMEAILYFEESHTGYNHLVGLDHRMTLLTLNNLATLYLTTGSTERGQSLLEFAVPVMERVLGPQDPLTWGAACNCILFSDGPNLSPTIRDIVERYKAQNTPESLTVLNTVGDHYGKNGLMRRAMESYKCLSEKRAALLGPSHPDTLASLYAYAYALDQLGEMDEASTQYRLLLSQPAVESLLPRSQIQGVRTALEEIHSRQKALDHEKADWGLTVPQKCTRKSCSNSTLRFCSGCKLKRFCSLECQAEVTVHQNECIPSVTLGEATFTLVENPADQSDAAEDADLLFNHMQLPRQPNCVSVRDVFINSKTFVTIRISKHPANMLSFRANPNLDIRFIIHGTTPFEWLTPDRSSMICTTSGTEDSFILVAPGKTMMIDLVAERDKVFGTESGDLDIPDKDLIEYAQTVMHQGEQEFILGFKVMEWAV